MVPWRVVSVEVLPDSRLRVRFADGLEGTVKFLPGFFRGVFSHLTDPELFAQAAVVRGAVTWPPELDLAPDAMHDEIEADGEWVLGNDKEDTRSADDLVHELIIAGQKVRPYLVASTDKHSRMETGEIEERDAAIHRFRKALNSVAASSDYRRAR